MQYIHFLQLKVMGQSKRIYMMPKLCRHNAHKKSMEFLQQFNGLLNSDGRLHLTRQFWMVYNSLILPGNDADGSLHTSGDKARLEIRRTHSQILVT